MTSTIPITIETDPTEEAASDTVVAHVSTIDDYLALAEQARARIPRARAAKRNWKLYAKLAQAIEDLVTDHRETINIARVLVQQNTRLVNTIEQVGTEYGVRDNTTGKVHSWGSTKMSLPENFPGYTVVSRTVGGWVPDAPRTRDDFELRA